MIYTALSLVGTAITDHLGASPSVAIRPSGHEADTGANKTYWVNLTPDSDSDESDGGGGLHYIGTHNIRVTVWMQDTQNDLASTMQTIGTRVAGVRDALRFSTLGTYCRPGINPTDLGGGNYMTHNDDSSRYGYQFVVRVAHQY